MISNCPHCRVQLAFSQTQQAKIDQAMKALQPGKRLTIKCPKCSQPIHLQQKTPPANAQQTIKPPAPPDLQWLQTGLFEDEEKVEDVPMALILHNNAESLEKIKNAMESVGYRVLTSDNVRQAIEQMRFINFACITYHADFEEGGLATSRFHNYMRHMPMDRRRYIFYILFGPKFHSLYDLEALAHSANLVVAEQDLPYFDIILRKSIPAYEELFGPILEELGTYGKK